MTTNYAPYTNESEAPQFSFLGSFAGFASVGGAVVAAIAFGGEPLAEWLKESASAEGASEFWKNTATKTADLAKTASENVTAGGEYVLEKTGLKEQISSKVAIAMAGAIGTGLAGAGIKGLAHNGSSDALHSIAHVGGHTVIDKLGHLPG